MRPFWAVIAASLGSDSVTIYFSSRATWNNDQYLTIPQNTSASAARPLILDGQSQYNTVASGTAVWQTETVAGNRATLTTVGYGDLYPVTYLGRAVAAALMMSGIAVLGVVTAFTVYVTRFFDPIRDLVLQYTMLQRAMASNSLSRS